MIPLSHRLEAKISIDPDTGCWNWLGFVDKAGYGRIRIGGRDKPVGYTHRLMYALRVGPIPDGLVVDHLCRNTVCCNPDHLEPVTNRTNVERGVNPRMRAHLAGTCQRGHPASESYRRKSTGRVVQCRACQREDYVAS